MNDDELGVAYRKRWTEAVGMREGALSSLVEERLLFTFALRHPRSEVAIGAHARSAPIVGAEAMLKRIDEHARIDPEYPADFARGVVLYRAGHFGRALRSFHRHLEIDPDGPLSARAHNHARAAVASEVGDPPESAWLAF
jgi:hypothetical protein